MIMIPQLIKKKKIFFFSVSLFPRSVLPSRSAKTLLSKVPDSEPH